jgi:hypothetical protein
MYTNINTEHAIDIMKRWLELHEKDLPVNYPKELVLEGIKRLMSNNTSSFGNRFSLQRNGTAMGTNVAYMYATIYHSYHEETQLLHLSYIKFYRRLIDDAFIIFDPNASFENLETNMNDFGPTTKQLHWKTEQPADTVNFLDLTVTIQSDGTITTRIFQKKMNLYLYRTPGLMPTGKHNSKLLLWCSTPILLAEYGHLRLLDICGTPIRTYVRQRPPIFELDDTNI